MSATQRQLPCIESLEPRVHFSYNWWGPTLHITAPGSYSGWWEHVVVTAPAGRVVLHDMHVETWDDSPMIWIDSPAQVVITRTYALAHMPPIGAPARFVFSQHYSDLTISHNVMSHTSGIQLGGWASHLSVTDNYAEDIDGRWANGWKKDLVQFIQLSWSHVGSGEIAYNAVVNHRGTSAVEDVISMYNSGGVAGSPLLIHDNLIDGAYAWPNGTTYSGGGIMAGDGDNNWANSWTWPSYVHVFSNTVINSDTYGVSVSAGHDIELDHNLVISFGARQSGSIAFSWLGEPEWNIMVHDEQAAWYGPSWQPQALWLPTATAQWNNQSIWMMPQQAEASWWNRMATWGRQIGRQGW